MRLARLVTVFLLSLAGPAFADEPDVIPHRQDRPPNKPYPAAEAVRRMTVPAGFAVELVAAEPDIVNPIAMTFDDRGRIWVTESVEYPRKSAGPGRGGVWVMNAPDLLFLREKNGKEVSREVVVTGFGRTDTHELPNSLTWGPDGWLYGLNGVFNQCRIRSNKGK